MRAEWRTSCGRLFLEEAAAVCESHHLGTALAWRFLALDAIRLMGGFVHSFRLGITRAAGRINVT